MKPLPTKTLSGEPTRLRRAAYVTHKVESRDPSEVKNTVLLLLMRRPDLITRIQL
jgi:hypothetical protein